MINRMQISYKHFLIFSDIDECSAVEKPCGSYNYLEGVNKPGAYTCFCEDGFHFNQDKKSCEGNSKAFGCVLRVVVETISAFIVLLVVDKQLAVI